MEFFILNNKNVKHTVTISNSDGTNHTVKMTRHRLNGGVPITFSFKLKDDLTISDLMTKIDNTINLEDDILNIVAEHSKDNPQ